MHPAADSAGQADHPERLQGLRSSPDKRVLAPVAGILVARHLKTTDDMFDSKPSPRTESLVTAVVQWAERIMRKIDGVFPK